MYLLLKNQRAILKKAIKEEGSYRKLAREINIPSSSLLRYSYGSPIPIQRAKIIMNFLNLSENRIKKRLPNNFKQKLGGKNCVLAKKKKGTFEKDMRNIQKRQSDKLKKWHRKMKDQNPKEYYKLQYSRFKKISGYKYKTKRGEKVRNLFEKQVADILYDLGVDYQYETLIKSNNKYFFPDFIINNEIILECTAWKGETKAYKLKEKIAHLSKNYQIYVVIPKALYRYYGILEYCLILGLDELASVAQTYLSAKTGRQEQ